MTQTAFAALGVAAPLCSAVASAGYVTPTPIQAQAIPPLLAGRDLLGIAQTGTGKTAAFVLPILQRLAAERPQRPGRGPSALILAPTRELAIQIGKAIGTYSRGLHLRTAVILGGVSQGPQVAALRGGLDILVATPGRLLDLVDQGPARLGAVSALVIDEADRMLDMGFIRDVRRIVAELPRQRQSMVFSATMPGEVRKLVGELLHDPVRVEVAPSGTAVAQIDQQVIHVAQPDKRALLERLLEDPTLSRVIVFTRTKHGADRVALQLDRTGVRAQAIHGNKSQSARQRALESFRAGHTRVLVATDLASRGIDVADVSHVINYELPNLAESYVHRIGRTARAGASGTALSFCDASERPYLREIEKLTRCPIPVVVGPVGEARPVSFRTDRADGRKPAAAATKSPTQRKDKANGHRYRKVVQRHEGVRVHSAG